MIGYAVPIPLKFERFGGSFWADLDRQLGLLQDVDDARWADDGGATSGPNVPLTEARLIEFWELYNQMFAKMQELKRPTLWRVTAPYTCTICNQPLAFQTGQHMCATHGPQPWNAPEGAKENQQDGKE